MPRANKKYRDRDQYTEQRRDAKRRYMARAQHAKKRLYEIFGYGAIKKVSDMIGKNQNYVANCLNGAFTSRPILLEIEGLIDAHDRKEADRKEYSRRKAQE